MKTIKLIVLAFSFTLLFACNNWKKDDTGLVAGAVVGAAAGSVLSDGAVFGTTAGAVGGAIAGKKLSE